MNIRGLFFPAITFLTYNGGVDCFSSVTRSIDTKVNLLTLSAKPLSETESESFSSIETKEPETSVEIPEDKLAEKKDKTEKLINDFCVGTNEFWKKLVIKPVRDYVEIQSTGTSTTASKTDVSLDSIKSKLIARPEVPGIPRPVWLTILGSVPTLLGWYGFYKFSVEEELFQYELRTNEGKVTGCGGYGTLFPFVYGVIIGFPLQYIGVPLGDYIIDAAAAWILLGQVNLYRRVNELYTEEGEEEPLYAWWALLPPPLDVVVGLRQVHFLSEYWRSKRDEPYQKDVVAEELFPFISVPKRFTLKEFFRTPSIWFWFTKDWEDFKFDFLQEEKK